MLQRMRESARGVVGRIIAVAIIIVLTLFGFGAVTLFSNDDPSVVEVGRRDVGQREVEQAFQRQRQMMQAQGVDIATVDEDRLRQELIEELVFRAVRLIEAEDLGLDYPEEEIGARIVQDEAFQDEFGRFDTDLFRSRIAQVGLNAQTYQQALQEDLTHSLLVTGVRDSGFTTEADTRTLAVVTEEKRDAAWLEIGADLFAEVIEVTEEDLESWFEMERERFVEAEHVDIAVLRFSPSDLAGEVTVSEEDVQSAFDAEAEAATRRERRQARHILLADSDDQEKPALERARELRALLEEGADFAELAREHSADTGSALRGGDLGYNGPGVYVPPFEEALWALERDELSAPVVSQFGVHLIQLTGIQSDPAPAFEDRADAIRDRLAQEAAEQLFTERVLDFEDWIYESTDLEAPAENFGLEISTIEAVTRESGSGIAANQAVRDAAFSSRVLEDGRNSDVITIGETIYALRIVERYPERQRELDEVREEVRAALTAERARVAASNAADKALADVESGASTAAVASAIGGQWLSRAALERDSASGVPVPVVDSVFSLPAPTPGDKSMELIELDENSWALVTVTSVEAGDYDAMPEARQVLLAEAARRHRQQVDADGYFRALRDAADITRR